MYDKLISEIAWYHYGDGLEYDDIIQTLNSNPNKDYKARVFIASGIKFLTSSFSSLSEFSTKNNLLTMLPIDVSCNNYHIYLELDLEPDCNILVTRFHYSAVNVRIYELIEV